MEGFHYLLVYKYTSIDYVQEWLHFYELNFPVFPSAKLQSISILFHSTLYHEHAIANKKGNHTHLRS